VIFNSHISFFTFMKIQVTHIIKWQPLFSLIIPMDYFSTEFTKMHLFSPLWLGILCQYLNDMLCKLIWCIFQHYPHQRSNCGFLALYRHKFYSFLDSSVRRKIKASKDSPNFPFFLRFSTVSFFRLIVVYMDYVRIARLTEVISKIPLLYNLSLRNNSLRISTL